MILEKHNIKMDRDINIEGTTYIVSAKPYDGFTNDYALFIPNNCDNETTLFVHAINTGYNVPYHLDEALKIAHEITYLKYNDSFYYATILRMPVLIPIFPRIRGYYTQALGSKVYNNDFSDLLEFQKHLDEPNRLQSNEFKKLKRLCSDLPEQLVNMIHDVKMELEQFGILIDEKVIIEGYSAGSKFANLFTALHPEIIKMCISGGNGGLEILPIANFKDYNLCFPLGVFDIHKFDFDTYKTVPQFFYIGDTDENDPASIKARDYERNENGQYIIEYNNKKPIKDDFGHVIPFLDKNGKIVPEISDAYTQEEVILIHDLFGKNVQERNNYKQLLYKKLGCNVVFKKYSGNHNTIFKYENGKCKVKEDVIKFIKNVIETKNLTEDTNVRK